MKRKWTPDNADSRERPRRESRAGHGRLPGRAADAVVRRCSRFALDARAGNPFAVFGLAAVAAHRRTRPRPTASSTEVSISVLPTVFAAAVFGPLAAMIVAVGFVRRATSPRSLSDRDGSQAVERPAYLKWGVYTCIRAIYGAAAGFAASAIAPLLANGVTRLVVATVTAALVAEPLDVVFGTLTFKLRGSERWRFVRMYVPMVVVSVSLYTPIVGTPGGGVRKGLAVDAAALLPPALAAQRLFGLYQEQRQLTDQLVDGER